MNSFVGWLKVVLVVAVLALLAGGVSFHRVQGWRGRQAVESNLKAATKFKANQIADWRTGQRGVYSSQTRGEMVHLWCVVLAPALASWTPCESERL
jgi:uncharacterized protein HemX